MFALRVDRLEPCQTPAEVGGQLGLPGSPASVLAAVADGDDCLLVVDQLDAISLASGRNPEFFDCIAALMEQARDYPKMRVLSACRKFDVENDYRLRQFTGNDGIAKEFPLGKFDPETVRRLVANLGIDANQLSSKQMDLLSLPVHLRLLSESTQDKDRESLGFRSAKDIYDRFWDYKQQKFSRSHIQIGQVLEALDSMLDYMNQRETLSVPASLFDPHPSVLPVLASENILIKDGSRVSFFHEGFLDYMFARRTVSASFDLLSYLKSGDQGLFLRSLVRQFLLHQRDISSTDALGNANELLESDEIRVHLKSIVIALLGSLEDPTIGEWEAMEPLLDTELSAHVWSSIYASPAWFDLLDGNGYISRWLASDEGLQNNRAVWLLNGVQQVRARRIAELLTRFIGSEDPWPQRLASVIELADIGTTREFFDFVVEAIKSGVLDDLLKQADANSDAWHLVEPLIVSNPGWACELLVAYCTRLLYIAVQEGETNPFPDAIDRHRTGSQVMIDAARAAPERHAQLLLPLLAVILEANADKTADPPRPDTVWQFGIYGDLAGLDDNFLESLVLAMRLLAQRDVDTFREFAAFLHDKEFLTVKYLLTRSYEANGCLLADEAVEYVLRYPDHLSARDRSDSHWITRKLFEATTPYCSGENLSEIEQAVLAYYPDYELDPSNRIIWGYAQLTLLEGIEETRLSDQGRRRLQELRRKFADRLPAEPEPFEGGWVGSPIPESSARKMSDQNWLSAIHAYSSYSLAVGFRDPLVGGPVELSRELKTLTEEDPVRFSKLIHSIPDAENPVFFEAILRGITDSGLDPDAVVAACLRCHKLPGRPLGRWITRPLEYLHDFHFPVEALEMVAWYALENADSVEEFKVHRPGQTATSHGYDLFAAGMNSVRGAAAGTIARLAFAGEGYLEYFEPHLRVMVNDESLAVRTCVAHALLSAMRHRRDLAVELFQTLCETDDRLLATKYVELFLKYAVKTHYEQMEPILIRMIESDIEEVATVGARQACLASLESGEAMSLATRCASGSTSLRLGMAEVYSANLKLSSFRSRCEEMLGKLFSDPDLEVRRAAAACFREFEGDDVKEFQGLIGTYINSSALTPGRDHLLRALEKATANVPEIILATGERFFDAVGHDAGDMRTGAALGSTQLSKLIVRAYSGAHNPEIKTRCLDLIDKMVLLRALGLDEVTAEFER